MEILTISYILSLFLFVVGGGFGFLFGLIPRSNRFFIVVTIIILGGAFFLLWILFNNVSAIVRLSVWQFHVFFVIGMWISVFRREDKKNSIRRLEEKTTAE